MPDFAFMDCIAMDLSEKLSRKLENLSLMMASAESCTGGMIAAAMTARPGSSAIFERGFVVYSNESKTESLGVPAALIREHGAVSAEAAMAMTRGAIKNSRADIAVAVTGIAGPTGGTDAKPVGLVYIAWGYKGEDVIQCSEHRFTGDRAAIRSQTVEAALKHLIKFVDTLA